ncbi:Sodium/sulfate symporter [Entamoeba marina]
MDLRHELRRLSKYKGTIGFFVTFTLLIHYMYFLDWYTHYETQLTETTYLFLMIFDVMMTVLIADIIHPGAVVFITVSILLVLGVIDVEEAYVGFSDKSTVTVMAALVLSAAINKVQLLDRVVQYLLPTTSQKYIFPSALRFLPFAMILSLFLNNTPVVAMSIPLVQTWSKTSTKQPSKLLMSVSFCAILGGMNSILGTSTNLVGRGLAYQQVEQINNMFHVNLQFEMPLFEIGLAAFPCALCGYLYCSFCSGLLPDKTSVKPQQSDEYRIPVKVSRQCPYINHHLLQTPFKSIPNGKLISVLRPYANTTIELTPDVIIEENDILIYKTFLVSVVDIYKQPGLLPFSQTAYKLCQVPHSVYICGLSKNVQTIPISDEFAVIGSTGEDITIANPHDKYLVITTKDNSQQKLQSNFLIADNPSIELPQPFVVWKAIVAFAALAIPISLDVMSYGNLVEYSLISIFVLLVTGILSIKDIIKAIDVPLYCILGASFGLSTAMVKTNAGSLLALTLTRLFSPFGKLGILAALYIPTMLLTQALSNTAVVAVMFPVVWAAYWGKDPSGAERGSVVGLKSSLYTMMLAASEVFVLPIGYQTNMMVMESGGYALMDYVRFGLPLLIITAILSVVMPWLVFEVWQPQTH